MIMIIIWGYHNGFIYVIKHIKCNYKLITGSSHGTHTHTHSVIDIYLIDNKYLITSLRD